MSLTALAVLVFGLSPAQKWEQDLDLYSPRNPKPFIESEIREGVLSDYGIAAAARSSGLRGDKLVIATAIAIAESKGEVKAHNTCGDDNSYGLWQINMKGSKGPKRREAFGIERNSELFCPVVNARAMYQISRGGDNWTPWSVYNNKVHKRYLGRAKEAARFVERK